MTDNNWGGGNPTWADDDTNGGNNWGANKGGSDGWQWDPWDWGWDDGWDWGAWDWDDGKKKEPYIPKSRFDEVNQAKKDAEAKLAEYEEKERKAEEKKKRQEGKYEELLTEKDATIAELTSKTESLSAMETALNAQTETQLKEIAATIWEEKMTKLLGIVGFENLDALWKADSIAKIKDLASDFAPSEEKKSWKWWPWTPPAWAASEEDAKKGGFNSYLKHLMSGDK